MPSRRSDFAAGVLLGAFVLAWAPSLALAQPTPAPTAVADSDKAADKASARALFFEGHDAFKAEDWARAEALFARSDKLFPAPTALLWQGRALAKLGRLVEAHERYREAVARKLREDASAGFRKAAVEAETEATALRPRLAVLLLTAETTTEVTIAIDGVRVPSAALGANRFVDPGEHRIVATAPGYLDRVEQVTLEEGQTLPLSLSPAEAPGEEAKRQRNGQPPMPVPVPVAPDGTTPSNTALQLAGVGFVGVGAAVLLISAVSGGLYLSEAATIDDKCNAALQCSEEGFTSVSDARNFALANTITLASGVVLAGVGVVMLVLASGSDDVKSEVLPEAAVAVAPYVGPEGAGVVVAGTF